MELPVHTGRQLEAGRCPDPLAAARAGRTARGGAAHSGSSAQRRHGPGGMGVGGDGVSLGQCSVVQNVGDWAECSYNQA